MKKCLILFVSLLVASTTFIGCGSDSPDNGPAVIEVLTPDALNQTVDANQATGNTIRVNTNNDWMSISTEDWAELMPSSGNAGTRDIVLLLTPNTTYEARTAIITIISGEATPVTITITQEGREKPPLPPVVFAFDSAVQTEMALPNARMLPFTVSPAGATISLSDSTGLIVYTFTHLTGRDAGQGRLTLTPRRDFAGGTFTVLASYEGMATATETLTLSAVERVPVGKRGVAMSTGVDRGNIWDNLYALRPHWWWSWGAALTEAQLALIPEGVEHVPTFWNGGVASRANINRINELYDRGLVRYIRGFNEPDLTEESNMTVEQALNVWEVLSRDLRPGIKLIGPAESHPRFGAHNWQMRFMAGVAERALRVDYMAVHIYASSPSAHTFTRYLERTYDAYGRRMWLMETGVRHPNTQGYIYGVHYRWQFRSGGWHQGGASGWQAGRLPVDEEGFNLDESGNRRRGGVHSRNHHTPQQIVTLFETLLPALEAMDIVHRYSWFEPATWMAGLWPGRLIGCDYSDHLPKNCIPYRPVVDPNNTGCNQLTIVGEFYRNFMPNTNIRRRH